MGKKFEMFWRFFGAVYLNKRRVSASLARKAASEMIRLHFPGESIPSMSTARRWIAALPPQIIAEARG